MNKKAYEVISFLCLTAFLLCGCSAKRVEYAKSEMAETTSRVQLYAYGENGLSLGETTVKVADDCNTLKKKGDEFQNKNASKNVTIEFNGKKYTGQYKYSITYNYCDYQTDFYIVDSDNENQSIEKFGIDSYTGKLSSVDLNLSLNEKTIVDVSTYREEAISFASDYIDTDKYKLCEKCNSSGIITYEFTRYLEDVATQAEFIVCYAGSLGFWGFCDHWTESVENKIQKMGEEQAIATAKELASKEAEKLVKEKMDYLYASEEKYTGFNIPEKYIIFLDDGSLGMIYECNAEFKQKIVSDGKEYDVEDGDFSTVLITTTEQ